MKIKLTNLIEGVNTAGSAVPNSTPTTPTPITTTTPTTPTNTKPTAKKNNTSTKLSDWKDWLPNKTGTVIGGALGYLFGGVKGALTIGALGNEVQNMVSGNKKTDSEPAKNQEHIDRHNDYLARTQRKLDRDRLARQAEIEAASHTERMARIGRSRRRIFEQQTLQFKPNTLKSLLEGGVVTDTLKFMTPTASPKEAAKRFIDLTTPQPGEDYKINYVRSFLGLSPTTFAKLQAGKAASAAAFDPTIGAEKIKHYANIIQSTDPINIGAKIAAGAGAAAQFELRNRLYYGLGGGRGPLSGKGLGTIAGLGALAGGIGGLVAPYTQAKALVAAKLVAAQKDDWRFAALPS
jgi:hypothetical protein